MNTLAALFLTTSQVFGLPPGLLSALCFTESSHRLKVVNVNDGGADSIGVCQIKVNTARTVGFTGTPKDLIDPARNIKYAAKYLKKQLDRYDGDIRKGIAAYNSGTFRADSNGLPMNKKYVKKVMYYWTEGR